MTEEKNSKSESKEEKPKKEWKLIQEQYDRLIEHSKKGSEGIEEWNEWINADLSREIWLQGAQLNGLHLEGASLLGAHLEGASLLGAHLEGASLLGAHLEGADLNEDAHLEGAKLSKAHMENTQLVCTHLEGAVLYEAHLEDANLFGAHLEGADVVSGHLEGAKFDMAHLHGAKFNCVFVNSATSFIGSRIDKETDFRNVSLDTVHIKQETKQLLKYNARRMNWEDWYKEHNQQKWIVRPFWWMSDYGRSTGRVLWTFVILALLFAVIYSNCACWWPPGVVTNLAVEPHLPSWHYFLLVLLRPVYFSIVTMTTLGFGDMFAHDESVLGHILLTLQVILGYVLLGALITRLAVLFTADGPAGSYTPMDKETKELLAKLKEAKKKARWIN